MKTPSVADWKEFVVNLGMAEEDKGKTGWRSSAKWARVLWLDRDGFYRNYVFGSCIFCVLLKGMMIGLLFLFKIKQAKIRL